MIHNIEQSGKREADKLLTYPVHEFNVGDKVLVKNHTRDYGVWNMMLLIVWYE